MKRVKLWGVALAAVVALGVAAGVGAQTSASQHRFSGSVTLDSTPAAAGTSVTAIVNGSECGSGTVITNAAGSTYVLDVPGDCAEVGDIVAFSVGGNGAAETGRWIAGGRTDLDLTASSRSIERSCPDGWQWDARYSQCAPAEPDEGPAEPVEPMTANVEVTVWRSVSNPSRLYLSTRPQDGTWRTQDAALDMSARSRSGRFHQSNAVIVAVPLAGGGAANVEVTVWRSISNPSRLYLSTRPQGGTWRTEDTALDMSALSRSRRFHQSNAVTVAVPLPEAATPAEPPEDTTVPVDRSQCRIDEAMAARVIASTVKVETSTGVGSAFYIGNGEFVTAAHVVDDSPRTITLRNQHVNVYARIVGFTSREDGDVAILSAAAPGMTALEWAGEIGAGAEVAVVGYPLGVGLEASISEGIVSRVFTDEAGVSQIQTSAPANPGNSGGPLVDACGRVTGVVSWKIARDSQGNATEGLAFVVGEPSLAARLTALRAGQYIAPVADSYLTTTAFCTKTTSENLSSAECDRRSSSLDLGSGRIWEVWAVGVSDWEDVVYRFNDGAELRQAGVQAALRGLGSGCHELEIAERGISTHWSTPYEFCFAATTGPTWTQMDALVHTIVERWNSTNESRRGLWSQWNAIINQERIPSTRLSAIALDLVDLSLATSETIGDLSGHAALANTMVADWRLKAWSFWLAITDEDLAYGSYAVEESTWGDVLWKSSARASAFADYKRAECAVWRLLYTSPDVACDQVAAAEQSATEAEAEARAWRPPAVATPTPSVWTLRSIDGLATLIADDGTYLGVISSSRFEADSICNRFGDHGSRFASDSVRNRFSTYGSSFGSQSAYSSYTTSPPRIYLDARAIGYLTKNDLLAGAVDPDVLFATYGCVY